MNETGTTIIHAPGAKKELRLFYFEHGEILKNLFDMRINLKITLSKLEKQRDNLIKLLIK